MGDVSHYEETFLTRISCIDINESKIFDHRCVFKQLPFNCTIFVANEKIYKHSFSIISIISTWHICDTHHIYRLTDVAKCLK